MPVIEVPSSVVFAKARSDACLFISVRTCSNMRHAVSQFFDACSFLRRCAALVRVAHLRYMPPQAQG